MRSLTLSERQPIIPVQYTDARLTRSCVSGGSILSAARRTHSPLRYPGGKAVLAGFLAQVIELNGLVGGRYLEPFAGGAGAALQLLNEGVVEEIHLNDADPRIHAFWQAVLTEPDRFVDEIRNVDLTIEEWRRQNQTCTLGDATDKFRLGFATFYLNRCNRSGVILGAAPIGGYQQQGKWKIHARFYRETLAKRIAALGKLRDRIRLTNDDALEFLRDSFTPGQSRQVVFAYLDPPYYSKGQRLYMNSYEDKNHQSLAQYLQGQRGLNWVLSYDDTEFVRGLYSSCEMHHLSLRYNLHVKRQANELLISPKRVMLPFGNQLTGNLAGTEPVRGQNESRAN